MKKLILAICGLLVPVFCSCDENKMCDEDADCLNICRSYDGNAVMYACVENACSCVSKEAMACTGDAERDHCEEICATYRPETRGVCVDSECACREKDCEKSADCEAKCKGVGGVKWACEANECQCLMPEAQACEGDDANQYCADLCSRYESGALGICRSGTCECQSSACAVDDDCNEGCALYGAELVSCKEGKCQCIGRETLACTGEDASARCSKICQMYKPGTLAMCSEGYCRCEAL